MTLMGSGGRHACVRWDPSVEAYFTACFGTHRLAAMSAALARPSLTPALRVNTLRAHPQAAAKGLQKELREQQRRQAQQLWGSYCERGDAGRRQPQGVGVAAPVPATATPGSSSQALTRLSAGPPLVRLHRRIPAVLVLSGRGPCDVDVHPGELPEVVVNRFAGEAVLKGAHVFAPGVLAASAGISAGDLVAVSAALERPTGQFGRNADGAVTETGEDDWPTSCTHAGRSGAGARLAVGISRGSTVDRDGSVPLAWASQPRPKQRRRQQQQQQSAGPGGSFGRSHEAGANRNTSSSSRYASEKALGCVGRNVGTLNGCGDAVRVEWQRPSGSLGNSHSPGNGSSSSERMSGADDSSVCSYDSSKESGCSSSSNHSEYGVGGSGNDARSGSRETGSRSLRSERVFLGVARAAVGRRAMFREKEGLALVMEQRVYDVPPCNGLLRGDVMLQALPSIVAAQVLNPRPGSQVLDMCAAPGGKTTALAALMGDRGRVVGLDRTAAKVQEILSLAGDLGASCVEAYQADATEAVSATAAAPPPSPLPLGPPPYPPGSFDYVLLDPPCTALGLRPRLLHPWTLKQMRAMAAYQRSLLHTAVQLLAPGGEMVYCTCTINPDENEANVAWALDKFAGSLELLPADPLVGLTGLVGADPETGARWLSEEESQMVQRFDPGRLLPGRRMAHGESDDATATSEQGAACDGCDEEEGAQPAMEPPLLSGRSAQHSPRWQQQHEQQQWPQGRNTTANRNDSISPRENGVLTPEQWTAQAGPADIERVDELPEVGVGEPAAAGRGPQQASVGEDRQGFDPHCIGSAYADDVMGFFIARFVKVR